jgi:hypothetical protein
MKQAAGMDAWLNEVNKNKLTFFIAFVGKTEVPGLLALQAMKNPANCYG